MRKTSERESARLRAYFMHEILINFPECNWAFL